MSEATRPAFEREYAAVLATRLAEPRRFLRVVAGPRQVGKTTLMLPLPPNPALQPTR